MGNGSRGFGVVSKAINTGFLDQKSAWMPLTLAEWKKRMGMDAFITPMLVSDFMDGPEYSLDVLVSRNKTQYCIPRKREKMIWIGCPNCKQEVTHKYSKEFSVKSGFKE
jgi:hypothetical protein